MTSNYNWTAEQNAIFQEIAEPTAPVSLVKATARRK